MENSDKNKRFTLILTLFILLIGTTAKAEFTEVIIDQTIVGPGSVTQDIDGDGNDDFTFEIIELSAGVYVARVTSIGLSSFMDKSVSGFPDALEFGEDVSGPFINGNGVLGMAETAANFSGVGDKYLGVRIVSGGLSYLGWIKLSCNISNDTLIIKTAGYNTNEGEQILAGQNNANSSIGDNGNSQIELTIFPNPCTDFLKVKISNITDQVNYSIYNNAGSIVLADTYLTSIDVSSLTSGVYYLEIKTDDLITRKRFMVN